MITLSAKDFEQRYGKQPSSQGYTAAPNSVFNVQAFKDVWTKASEDINLASQQSSAKASATAVLQGGLAPFRSVGAGVVGSETGQKVTGNIIDGLTKFGEAITPDIVLEKVGEVANQVIEGYDAMTPQQQLTERNKLAVAELLSYYSGGSAAKDAVISPTVRAGESILNTAKNTVKTSDDALKDGFNLRESVRSIAGDSFAEPQLKTSLGRLVDDKPPTPDVVEVPLLRGTTERTPDILRIYDDFLAQSEKALTDIKTDPAISVVGEDIGNAFQNVIKQRQAVGKVLGNELDTVGGLKVSIESTIKDTLNELAKGGLSYNSRIRQLTSFQGSKFVTEEINMLNEFVSKMKLLGESPTVRDIDRFISRTRTELKRNQGQTGVYDGTNADRIIDRALNNLRNEINPEKNGIGQLQKYWDANETYSNLSKFVEEGASYLGKLTQSGDFAKDASIAKSAVQSILNNGKKDWLLKLEALTGYQALDYSVLALQAMKDAGDFRGLSLLQAIKDQGLPTSKAGFTAVMLDKAVDIGKRAVLGKPADQTRAFLKSLTAAKAELRTPSKAVRAPKGVPKTKEIKKLEGQIDKNVKAQKAAIKAGDFALVAKLKEAYQKLVDKLKELVKTLKEDQGGFAKNFFSEGEPNLRRKALQDQLKQINTRARNTTNKTELNRLKKEADKLKKMIMGMR